MTSRTIVIGDVHGCAREFDRLLSLLAPVEGDRVVMVGDLVMRGPQPAEVVRLARDVGALAVRGNHEHRLLRWRAVAGRAGLGDVKRKPGSVKLTKSKSKSRGRVVPPAEERRLLKNKNLRRTAEQLCEEDWAYLERMPLWIDLPQQRLRVVHAGVLPSVPIEEQPEHVLLFIRCIDRRGAPSHLRGGGALWGSCYEGPPHVVFGHNALHEPQLHPWATGIDTGCVYGGALTALVLPSDQDVPPARARRDVLLSVPAFTTYVPIQ